MKIISIVNQKGGVDKTTIAVKEHKVLLIYMDYQGSFTRCTFRIVINNIKTF
jgi:cellulose biosynthesis protein BcsQ